MSKSDGVHLLKIDLINVSQPWPNGFQSNFIFFEFRALVMKAGTAYAMPATFSPNVYYLLNTILSAPNIVCGVADPVI